MELNREQIVKAMECCKHYEFYKKCKECVFSRWKKPTCRDALTAQTLRLYRELTEHNAQLLSHCTAKDIIIADLNAENARLRVDTLREIQNRFAVHFGTYTPKDTVKITEVFKLLATFEEDYL